MPNPVLLLDFGSNRREVREKNNDIFSNSLEEQFDNMPNLGEEYYEDFIRNTFMKKNTAVFISYPNFNRKKSKTPYGDYYNNIALRFPTIGPDRNDLVLMCNIFERKTDPAHPERLVQRTFQAKAILLMDPGLRHFGEIKKTCDIIINLGEKTETVWESEDSKDEWIPENTLKNNVITNDFLLKLDESYVVPNSHEVITKLKKWKSYLNSRKYLINEESKKGYCLDSCEPDFFRAFSNERDVNTDEYGEIQHLDSKKWTTQKVDNNSREALLMHVFVDVLERETKENKDSRSQHQDYKTRLDGFTRSPLVLEDRSTRQPGNKRSRDDNLRIDDGRISISAVETVEPLDKINNIVSEKNSRIKTLRNNNDKAFKIAVKNEISIFENEKLPALSDDYISKQRTSEVNRITTNYNSQKEKQRSAINKELDKLKAEYARKRDKLHSLEYNVSVPTGSESTDKNKRGQKTADDLETLRKQIESCEKRIGILEERLENLDNEFDPSEAIEQAISNIRESFEKDTISEETDAIKTRLEPEFDKQFHATEAEIEKEAQDDIAEVKRNFNISRFHLFFEIEVSDNESIESKIKSLSAFKKKGLMLNRDFTGEGAILDRQEKALNNLMEGNVLNPFLATFLFSPESNRIADDNSTDEMDNFINRNLNEDQKKAVKMALSSNGLFLIQGPPGTGKTAVIAEISAQLARNGKKVLIASQNNKAVDNAFDRIPKIPAVRLLRVLSEKANKHGNNYSIEELVRNFYTNISAAIDAEKNKLTYKSEYMNELESSIGDLSEQLVKIKAYQKKAEDTTLKIKEKQRELRDANTTKNKIKNSNISLQNEISDKYESIEAIKDFSDANIFTEAEQVVNKCGFIPSDYGDNPPKILSDLYARDRESISKEYATRVEHGDYYELRTAKESCNDLNERAALNQRIREYEEIYNFDPQISTPYLHTLNKVPDKKVLLDAKDALDGYVEKKVSRIEESLKSLNEDIRSTDEVDSEIDSINREIEELEKDKSYIELENAKKAFNTKAHGVYTHLNIPMPGDNFEDILSKLRSERNRIKSVEVNNKDSKERISTYSAISKYLMNESTLEHDKDRYNKQLLETVNVFGITCSVNTNSRDERSKEIRLNERNIDVVIVDEVSKVPFIEVLQPILYGKTIILVGDHRQLPPMFNRRLNNNEDSDYDPEIISKSDEAQYRKMYEESFFAKLFDMAPDRMKVQLRTQYRMHPYIMDVDNIFYRTGYGGELTFGGNESQKEHYLEITGTSGRKIIGPKDHVLFIDVPGRERKESGSTSFTNPEEVKVVIELLNMIDKNCRLDCNGNKIKSSYGNGEDTRLSVGVICAYRDQAREIGKSKKKYGSFNKSLDCPLLIKTVDDFQGDERDIIILSLVRTRKTGFLEDYRRINVAISRARRLLIIVGNKSNLEGMKVDLDGRSVFAYREILNTIERKNGMRKKTDILGGERCDIIRDQSGTPSDRVPVLGIIQSYRQTDWSAISATADYRGQIVPKNDVGRGHGNRSDS